MTFSELIDSTCQEVSRLDLKAVAQSYLNQTIRECHMDPDRNTALFFKSNYQETQVTADVESAFAWAYPDTRRFQGVQVVRFDSVINDGFPAFADPLIPGRVSNAQDYAYQEVGGQVIFKGYGGVGGIISLAYFEFPKGLKYYAVAADRPATYDLESGWSYHADYSSTTELQAEARGLVSNWLIERWDSVLEEGLRAKIYKRLSDDTRARTSYSLYMQQRQSLINSELADLHGVR